MPTAGLLLDGVRVLVDTADASNIYLDTAVVGFRDMVDAGGINGSIYSYVMECNIDAFGVAHDREGGLGYWSSSANSLSRICVWSTLPASAQIPITGPCHVIITPITFYGNFKGRDVLHGDSDYTITMADGHVYTNANLSAHRTWTLPNAGYKISQAITISDMVGGVNKNATITIATTASQLINGQLTYVLRNPFESVTLVSTITGWTVKSKARSGHDILKTGSFSATSNLDIVLTPYLALGYRSFKFRFHHVVFSATGPIVFARLSTDAGSTFAATGYACVNRNTSDGHAAGAWSGSAGSPTGCIAMFGDNTSEDYNDAEFDLSYDPASAGYAIMKGRIEAAITASMYLALENGMLVNASDVDAIRFAVDTGNMTGSYTMIGIR